MKKNEFVLCGSPLCKVKLYSLQGSMSSSVFAQAVYTLASYPGLPVIFNVSLENREGLVDLVM